MSFHTIDPAGILPTLCVEVDATTDPKSAVRTWTDITTSVRHISFSRSGRNDEQGKTNTGVLTAMCDDAGGAISGLGLHKAQWIRVRAQYGGVTYPRWQGIVTSMPRTWPARGKQQLIQLDAADVLYILRLYDLADQTFASQRNDQRVSAICALAGLTTGSIDADTDTADAISSPISEGTDALSTVLDIEASENGLILADPAGTVSFQGRHYRLLNSATSVATFGEGATDIPYRDSVEYDDDDNLVANVVSVTPMGGAAVTVSDSASQAKYWTRRLNRSLLTSNATIAADCANFLLARYKDPAPRIPVIDVPLVGVATKHAANLPTLLAADNSDRFTWDRAATTPISTDVYVEQISETITRGAGWTLRMQLSPAIDDIGWVLGDAVNGVLNETTRLVY